MTPEEFVKECCWPGHPPGYQFCQVREAATVQGWTEDQISKARDLIMERYNTSMAFPWPRAVRYV